MSKLPLVSSQALIKALLKDGFQPRGKSRRGSHQALVKALPNGRKLIAIVPLGKREIPPGTLSSILRQAQIPRERLRELL